MSLGLCDMIYFNVDLLWCKGVGTIMFTRHLYSVPSKLYSNKSLERNKCPGDFLSYLDKILARIEKS